MSKKSWILAGLVVFLGGWVVHFSILHQRMGPGDIVKSELNGYEILDEKLQIELDLSIEVQWQKHRASWLPVSGKNSVDMLVFYAHGYMGPIQSSSEYSNYVFCALEGGLRGFRYSVCTPGFDGRKKYMSFAQGFDIYQVCKHLRRLLEERDSIYPDVPVICIGHSNGASTLISAICKNDDLAARIAGVILLAPYANIAEVTPLKTVPRIFGGESAARGMLKWFLASSHDSTALSPVQHVEQGSYSNCLPTLLAHSKADLVVPYKNFEMLRAALSKRNQNVQFLALEKDSHFFRRPSSELKEAMRVFVEGVVTKASSEK